MTSKIKKGALRRQLGIPAGKKVPKTFVKKITKADIGTYVTNPTGIGKSTVKVTLKLRKRADFVESFV